MGAAVSRGSCNDELVDNLMMGGYIRTKQVERVFRAVDRGDYVLPSHRDNVYEDIAWIHGNIHLSAPCVYSKVMEALSLEPGQSFLNLGSGTGYFSTMAGLILNQHGTNHGIELHEDCIKYAYERLEEFKQKSLALDQFDFCEPLFVQGNCLNVAPGRQYDRVYCGAECPESHIAFIKQFVRVGGILVMPFKDDLFRIQRISEYSWLHDRILPVSFLTLVPARSEQTLFYLPECCPLSLQELCRAKIRYRLRQNIWQEHIELETRKPIMMSVRTSEYRSTPLHGLRRFLVSVFDESESNSESDEEDEYMKRVCLLLNYANPTEPHSTTSQVRAVIQPGLDEDFQNCQDVRHTDDNDQLSLDSANFDSEGSEGKDNSNRVECLPDPVEANVGESSFDSMQGQSEDQNQRPNGVSNTANFEKLTNETHARISESDSEAEQDEDTLIQRKKIPRRDSEGPDSDIEELFCPGLKSLKSAPREEVTFAHYVDNDTFTTYMKEKIHQLPLPFSLKLYINYNRKL